MKKHIFLCALAAIMLVGCAIHPVKGKTYTKDVARDNAAQSQTTGISNTIIGSLCLLGGLAEFWAASETEDDESSNHAYKGMGWSAAGLLILNEASNCFKAKTEWEEVEAKISSMQIEEPRYSFGIGYYPSQESTGARGNVYFLLAIRF